MNAKWQIGALVLVVVTGVLVSRVPDRFLAILHNLLALSNIALLLFAAAVLLWFLYVVILRRILRARRIANARMRRMMQEAAERAKNQQ